VKKRNELGEVEFGPDKKPIMVPLRPSTRDDPNPEPKARWYRGGSDGKTFNHAWFIGFAPAENPKIAFCVLIEYGVSGGTAAGSVAKEMLEACIERGLECFEPGAGGEHKHARGFESTLTHSVHQLRDPRLRGPVERFLRQESSAIIDHLGSEKPVLKAADSTPEL
jgi:hypothetical protein